MNDAQPVLIDIKGLHKHFPSPGGELKVLTDLNMQVMRSEIVAVVGASGLGKTTLLHILGALEKPSKGQILFDGQPVSFNSDRAMARFRNSNVGFVFQMHHLIPEFNALENVMLPLMIKRMGKSEARARAADTLGRVGLQDRLRHMPGALSGGEQQRVAIARALVTQPTVVLADEPTGNLDLDTGDRVFELIQQINSSTGTTFVIVTHNERLARRMNRMVLLEGGQAFLRSTEAPTE